MKTGVWYEKLAHQNVNHISTYKKSQKVLKGHRINFNGESLFCELCAEEKQYRQLFPNSKSKLSRL